MKRVTRAAATRAKQLLTEQGPNSKKPRLKSTTSVKSSSLHSGRVKPISDRRKLASSAVSGKKKKNSVSSDLKETLRSKNDTKVVKPKVSKEDKHNHTPPETWQREYELMKILRARYDAPVDSMGAEALPEKHHGPTVFRYQVLIALMLSSQTKDQMVAVVMRRLQDHGLSAENIQKTRKERLVELLYGVGFHNKKAEYIKQATDVIMEKFDGEIPTTVSEMIQYLPGVGPKMAFLVANIAFDKPVGIGVDTHVLRFCFELGWSTSKNPEVARKQLESWLPKSEWIPINLIMVGLGQQIQQKAEKGKLLKRLEELKEPEKSDAKQLLLRLGFKHSDSIKIKPK